MFRKSVTIDLVEPIVCLQGQPKDKQSVNILRGAIRLLLSRNITIQKIVLRLVGVSKTFWPEAPQHWDKHVLVDSQITISNSKMLLKKGTHNFPFEILLSNALSESIECGLGHVRYKIHCQVHVKPPAICFPCFHNIFNLQTQKAIRLVRLPTLESQQQCITQTHHVNSNSLTIIIEKSCLVPGTRLPVSVFFNNDFVKDILQMDAKLIEKQRFKGPQATRILHHEILLASSDNDYCNIEDNECKACFLIPDKHTIKLKSSTATPHIKIRHWIQVYLKFLLTDGTTKDLYLDAPISIFLPGSDDYLTLPLYQKEALLLDYNNAQASWIKKKNRMSASSQQLMMLITAPPPQYEENIM